MSPMDYYNDSDARSEDPFQLFRRISEVWHVLTDSVEISKFDKAERRFAIIETVKNPVKEFAANNAVSDKSGVKLLEEINRQFFDEQLSMDMEGAG